MSFKKDLQQMLMHYLARLNGKEKKGNRIFMEEEFEVRFKPHNKKHFSKIDYDNVISRLMSCGFESKNVSGTNMLRIQTQYTNEKNILLMSNIRSEFCGADIIQEYCENDEKIQKLIENKANLKKIKFTQKSPAKIEIDGQEKPIPKITNNDFDFNVSFNLETNYYVNQQKEGRIKSIIDTWSESKKTYRLINRVRFTHEDSPIAIDLSILRTSKTMNGVMIPEYSIRESELFSNQEVCEIELEIINEQAGVGIYSNIDKIIGELQRVIKIVLGGLQSTKFPISYAEQEATVNSYMELIFGKEHHVSPRFVGPNSCTLQLKNITNDSNSNEPNIRNNYCVTDKADGERKMMYINKDGKIYLIDTNLRIQFTGSIVDRNRFGNTLIDGENILYDKNGKYKNTYAAFDVYFANGKPVSNLDFWVDTTDKLTSEDLQKYRYSILTQLIQDMNDTIRSSTSKISDIEIVKKKFYFPTKTQNIFKKCSELLAKLHEDTYLYETDGLIFTPVNKGVGGMEPGQLSRSEKNTWPLSLKWKPPEFNTIDFLVSYKVDKQGKEVILNKFDDGMKMAGAFVCQYRTIVLMCGFNRKRVMDPFQDLLDDNIPSNDFDDSYEPVNFIPNMPYDPEACFANIQIDPVNGKMMTKSGEMFEKDMIVEFSYDKELKTWSPLRVRHDKTYDFKMNGKNFGNSYWVANDNWKSIHYPVQDDMLRNEQNIPNEDIANEVYYNKTNNDSNYTNGLRNFHNLYVKKRLIAGVSKADDTLIDYAVGKGGDIPKWKESRLRFVFGVDVSTDNIYNQNDGACARYLNERKYNRYMFNALFLPGNSGLNIRDGTAFAKDKLKDIANAVFGRGNPNPNLGKAVAQNYGIGKEGFNVSSCQFAIHYFFENNTVLHKFLQNVSECTREGGYFVGTCYDGQTVFNKLSKKDSYAIHINNKKIFDIHKKYVQTGFPDDETGVGYPISVYQESINKYAVEYLVNFDYLIRLMGLYGFILVGKEEAMTMGFPNGSGLFEDLFRTMEREKNTKMYGKAVYMSNEEKEISFLNRYFIFRKTQNVNAEKVFKAIKSDKLFEEEEKEEKKKEVKPKMFIKKLKRKIVLNKYEPIVTVEKVDSNESDEFTIDIDKIMGKK